MSNLPPEHPLLHAPVAARKTILVIEKIPAIRDMLYHALELDGYCVATAVGEMAALPLLQQAIRSGRGPTAILLGLCFPSGKRVDFLRQLYAPDSEGPSPIPPIIILSANRTNLEEVAECRVVKAPFHIRDLLSVVRSAIAGTWDEGSNDDTRQ